MRRKRKQICKLLLSVCMVCIMLPLVAFAKGGGPDSCKPWCAREITAEFSDVNFLAEVRAALGKNKNEPIYDTDNFASVTELSIYNKSITNLAGIQYFTALTHLDCYNNQLTALDLSNNTALTHLECFNNQLITLNVSKNTALTYLECFNNQLSVLDVSNNTNLTFMACEENQLSALDVSNNTNLARMVCYSNQLSALDVSKNIALNDLYCFDNQLSTLDVSKNIVLNDLDCHDNRLSTLDVSNNTVLHRLDCSYNYMADESAITGLNKNLTTTFIFEPQYSSTPTPAIVNNTSQSSNQTVFNYVPTTPEEILRYGYKGKETVEFTYVSNPSKVSIIMNNSIQGKLFFDSIANVLGDYQIGRTYNIFANGNQSTGVIENPVTITLTIPEVLRKEGRTFKMIGVLKNGMPYVLEDIDADEKTITIMTNHFYAFALVYSDK